MFVELNNENFNNEVLNGLKLVDFYTQWCGFCKKQNDVLKDLSDNGFWIGKLDCDKNSEIAQKYGITGYPSFILFKNGEAVAHFSGLHTKTQLLNRLTSYL